MYITLMNITLMNTFSHEIGRQISTDFYNIKIYVFRLVTPADHVHEYIQYVYSIIMYFAVHTEDLNATKESKESSNY